MASLIDAHVADLTDREFAAMVGSGAFGDRRVFLWDGIVCEKMAKTTLHGFVGFRIARALTAVLPPGWDLWHEEPVRLGARYVPLPDLAVLRGPEDRYRCYWVADVGNGLMIEHRDPRVEGEAASYGSIVRHGPDSRLTLVPDGQPAGQVAVGDIFR